MRKKCLFYGTCLLLILLSLLATIKICFLNLSVDEEYAITLSCRILSKDRMFRDIWEPHQTSGFLTALLCQIYQTVTGTSEYMVLYLRICGAMLQAALSIFLYQTWKLSFSRFGALVAAFFFYNTLPKQIQTPEFSNMLVWFSVLTLLCLFRACHGGSRRWFVAAGISICGMVLAYPSCILTVPAYFLGLKKLRPQSFRKEAGILLLVCGICGICYIAFFLSHMSLPEFLFGLQQMMTDGYHSDSPGQRLASYGQEVWNLLPHLCLIALLACLLFLMYGSVKQRRGGKYSGWHLFACCILCVSLLEQICIWLGNSLYFHYPLLHFYILYGIGMVAYWKRRNENNPQRRTLFWFGTVCGGCVWFAALIVTNTTISVTGSYLISGLIPAILLLTEEPAHCCEGQGSYGNTDRLPIFLTVIALLGTTLFAKGFLVCRNEGRIDDIFVVRQKFLQGPAKNIYGIYMEGYAYNSYAELLEGCCTSEDSLFYVGEHSLYYLLTESRIAVPSTISTPTFDSRLLEYWSYFPEHYPTLVVIPKDHERASEIRFVKEVLCLEEPFRENAEFAVYKVEQIPVIE